MTEPRLATEIWVSAYLTRLRLVAIPAFITAKGDPTAGSVLVKMATLDGDASVWERAFGPDFERVWTLLVQHGPEAEADAAIARQRARDPDLWVIEVEDRAGRHLLDEEGLA